jgi:class 3 adenylate cyclase/tetratricopeptide (TPR) repeat protein
MQCSRCQHENRAGRKFCSECGASLAPACPACGFSNEPGEKFCGGCGTSLGAPTTPRFAAPETYTPKHLAERIITSKAALEGERKQVTVLFADLKGSMELLADRDPEEARKLLDPVLERMMEAVHRYEGTVNQVMGDGIMALFGAPLAHEDHAVRACYAALRMQESVKKYADEVRRSHAAVVKIRVGLNSGEVVVRAIGSDLHMDYTAVGQTTHLAARMEQIADPGAIVITPETLVLAEGYVEVKSLGPVPVRGLAEAMEVYEVTGAGPARTRLQAATRRGLTRFVGRDVELEQLRRAQKLAADGHGQVAAIVGEAGVGKSRLVYEFTHSHRLQGCLVLESASVSYGRATSYLPVIDLLKGYFKLQDRDELREIREKVTGKLLTLDEALKPTLPALLALLDVPMDDAAWHALDPGQRRHRTLDAVKRLLLREAREQPVLAIFEDLHWIDTETQAILDALVDSLGSARLLLLVNYRPEYQHAWGSKTYYGQMRLDALPAESAGELLEALLGDDPGLQPLKQLLVKRGNPFFLEETVRTFVETKALAGERGRYRLTQPVQAIQVPLTVQVMLAARIDRLAPEDKRLLQISSVVGKDVPFTLLQAVADLPDEAVRRGLDHLQSAEFVYQTGLFPDLEYTFKHALTHDVAYTGLLHERRRAIHVRVVEAIERAHAGRLVEHTERLAHHALAAELWPAAITYLRKAAARAAARSAYREARARLEEALSALAHLPHGADATAQAIDLRLDLADVLIPLSEYPTQLQRAAEAQGLAEAAGDRPRLARALTMMCSCLRMVGENRRAIEAGERALAISHEHGNARGVAVGAYRLGQAHLGRGDLRRAGEKLAESMRLLGEAGRPEGGSPAVTFRAVGSWLGIVLGYLGRFGEAYPPAIEVLRSAETERWAPVLLIIGLRGLGHVLATQGELDRAAETLERNVELCRATGISDGLSTSLALLGQTRALLGQPREAFAVVAEAAEIDRAGAIAFGQSVRLARISEIQLLAAQDPEEAGRLAAQALVLARARDDLLGAAYAEKAMGDTLAAGASPSRADAEGHYRMALALAKNGGMRPLVAHCHLGLGKLYRRTGKRDQAQEHLTTATTMYREMDMRFWLEKAEAEMGAWGARMDL